MKKRKWTGQQKLQIVLEGTSGKIGIADLCNRHGVNQSQYYKWRDQLLKSGASLFDTNGDKKVDRLANENKRLISIIGKLTVELKKTEGELAWLES
jgi:transposase